MAKKKNKKSLQAKILTTIEEGTKKGAKVQAKLKEAWEEFEPLRSLVDLIADRGAEVHIPGGLVLQVQIKKEPKKGKKSKKGEKGKKSKAKPKKAAAPKKPKKTAKEKPPAKAPAKTAKPAKAPAKKRPPAKKAPAKKAPAKKKAPPIVGEPSE